MVPNGRLGDQWYVNRRGVGVTVARVGAMTYGYVGMTSDVDCARSRIVPHFR
jgi:hypothetical protein